MTDTWPNHLQSSGGTRTHPMKSDRIALIVSFVAMVLIWLFVTGLLADALHNSWKGNAGGTFVGVLSIVSLVALWVLIPVQIIQSFRKKDGAEG